jgi:hypothetical protein
LNPRWRLIWPPILCKTGIMSYHDKFYSKVYAVVDKKGVQTFQKYPTKSMSFGTAPDGVIISKTYVTSNYTVILL